MAKFLSTSGINHLLEELIKGADEQIVLLTPYLDLQDRLRALLAERSRKDLKIQLIYRELRVKEERWLREVPKIKVKKRPNLHAKCYLTEKACIITSLNLLEFSQQNNDEMGILVLRDQDPDLYQDAAREVRQIILGSEETHVDREDLVLTSDPLRQKPRQYKRLTVWNLAKKRGVGASVVYDALIGRGLMNRLGRDERLTERGAAIGACEKEAPDHIYTLWPADLPI